MTIDNNEQALATMRNVMGSFENRFRSVYNYGYKDGYEQGLKDATSELIRKILEDKCGDTESEQTVYCMDCAKSEPLDEHGALWYCKAHDRTTLRRSCCNNGERKGGDSDE